MITANRTSGRSKPAERWCDVVFDSPKAAHFNAFLRGTLLSHDNNIGLAARWDVANKVKQQGVVNMLDLSLHDRLVIGKTCSEFNANAEWSEIVVQLRLD